MANKAYDHLLAVMRPSGNLIRYTAILHRLKQVADGKAVKDFVQEVNKAGRTCDNHGYLQDPVIGVDMVLLRLIVGCPWCSGSDVLEAWSAQKVRATT